MFHVKGFVRNRRHGERILTGTFLHAIVAIIDAPVSEGGRHAYIFPLQVSAL